MPLPPFFCDVQGVNSRACVSGGKTRTFIRYFHEHAVALYANGKADGLARRGNIKGVLDQVLQNQ